MGRNSSGVRGGLQPRDSGSGIEITGVEPLKNIKDPKLYKETAAAISRYHSVMGVRERNVKLADLPPNTGGAQTTSIKTGESTGIYLNKKMFSGTKASIEKNVRRGYNSGWLTRSNKPVAHYVTHELAHATWNSDLKGAKYKAAQKEIYKLSGKWLADKRKKGYGKYAHSDLNEFWAEVVTKAVHGTPDKYTQAAKRIVKKYKL